MTTQHNFSPQQFASACAAPAKYVSLFSFVDLSCVLLCLGDRASPISRICGYASTTWSPICRVDSRAADTHHCLNLHRLLEHMCNQAAFTACDIELRGQSKPDVCLWAEVTARMRSRPRLNLHEKARGCTRCLLGTIKLHQWRKHGARDSSAQMEKRLGQGRK
eukprot:6180908-Pleurochrysis_carterae.AAC.1